MANLDLKVLCIDDDAILLEKFKKSIVAAGYTPSVFSDPTEAVRAFVKDRDNVVIVLSDFQMPGMTGLEARAAIGEDLGNVPFVILTNKITKEIAVEGFSKGITAFCEKPNDEQEFAAIIARYGAARAELINETKALESVFLEESGAIIEALDPLLLSLDSDRTNPDKLNAIFRGVHTIKGSSGVLSTNVVTRYVHRYEDIISGITKGKTELTDNVYEVLLKGLDRVKELVAAVAAKTIGNLNLDALLDELDFERKNKIAESPLAKGHQMVAAQPHPGGAAGGQTVKNQKDSIAVPIEMLDKLSSFSGEITVIRNMVNKLVKGLERQYSGNKEIHTLGELLDEMHKINSTIQTHITDLRKVPLSGVLKPVPRIIRDLAKDLNKSIALKIEGDKIRVDNGLATVCSNSIVHLVRNSADHGLEVPASRRAAGKPEQGTITINCAEVGEEVHISVGDNGRGLNYKALRNKAVEKGIYTAAQVAELTDQQIAEVIFKSGFSTAEKVTDVSGRGVGMDMVKSSVEAVGGKITIDSRPGDGTTFTMKLPIPKSVLIITSLLVEAGDRVFAVPQDSIRRVLRIEPSKFKSMVAMASLGRTLCCDGEIYPLVSLHQILGIPPKQESLHDSDAKEVTGTIEILILETDRMVYALQVDSIQDAEEIVVKAIQSYFNTSSAFAGATFMGDGTVGLILDVKGLAKLSGIDSQTDAAQLAANTEGAQGAGLEGTHSDARSFLLFRLGNKALFGVPLEQVFRLEEFEASRVQRSGGEQVIIYRDSVMPLYSMDKLLNLSTRPGAGAASPGKPSSDNLTAGNGKRRIMAIVAKNKQGFQGLEVESIEDIAETDQELIDNIRDRVGVVGNAFIRDNNVTIVDIDTVISRSLSA